MIIYLQMIESDEDKSKFEQLYIMYKGLMFHVAMKILKNEFDAEDAVHQAFLSLIENLKKISDVKCPKTRAYIVIITERKAIDIIRSRSKLVDVEFWESTYGIEIPLPGDHGLADAMARLPAAYPAQGISVQGQQVFLRTSRGKWWLSKCIWCIASCTLYFACEMIAIIGTAILTPVTFGLNNTPEITAFLFSEVLCGETISLTPASVILYALLLPFVTLTAVCMLQTLLNLVARPAISFLICFVTYIAAAYFPIEWLVGNGAMVMRYQLFDANGLSYRKELVFTLLLLLLSIGAGYLLIQRKDLISLEK